MDTNSIEAGRQEGEHPEMDRTENNEVEAKAESDVEEVGMDGTVENENQATESEGDFFFKKILYSNFYKKSEK